MKKTEEKVPKNLILFFCFPPFQKTPNPQNSSNLIQVQGHDVVHELLNSLEFTSERARMSVITRSPDGTIRLHAKGSDAALLPLLRQSTDGKLLSDTQDNLRAFSSRGLRTLLLASRVLGEEEWRAWNARHAAAAATLAGRGMFLSF